MALTLTDAHRLLPRVQAITQRAAAAVDAILREVDVHADAVRRSELEREMRRVVEDWAQEVSAIGGEAKGLWLVDFDNGEGYWCWQHPEPTIEYTHGYTEGFAGRRLIDPDIVH